MRRVKGYCNKILIQENPLCATSVAEESKRIYVEQITPDAVRAEGRVVDGPFLTKDGELELDFYLPARLIGKRVEVIIMEVE